MPAKNTIGGSLEPNEVATPSNIIPKPRNTISPSLRFFVFSALLIDMAPIPERSNAEWRGRRPAPAGLRSLSNAELELEL